MRTILIKTQIYSIVVTLAALHAYCFVEPTKWTQKFPLKIELLQCNFNLIAQSLKHLKGYQPGRFDSILDCVKEFLEPDTIGDMWANTHKKLGRNRQL